MTVNSTRSWRIGILALALTAVAGPAMTGAAMAQSIKVVELFTSHGCSSCPRADDLLGEMTAADPQLLLLEFHVDYWNSLVHGGAGNFVDPYSSSEYTDRQRRYRQVALRGRPGVYTPQAIINGRTAAVGSQRAAIEKAFGVAVPDALKVRIDAESNALFIEVSGDESTLVEAAGAEVVLMRFHRQRTTEITGGENKNRTLDNHNIVHEVRVLGTLGADEPLQYRIDENASGDGCAVLIQTASLETLHAATACPG